MSKKRSTSQANLLPQLAVLDEIIEDEEFSRFNREEQDLEAEEQLEAQENKIDGNISEENQDAPEGNGLKPKANRKKKEKKSDPLVEQKWTGVEDFAYTEDNMLPELDRPTTSLDTLFTDEELFSRILPETFWDAMTSSLHGT